MSSTCNSARPTVHLWLPRHILDPWEIGEELCVVESILCLISSVVQWISSIGFCNIALVCPRLRHPVAFLARGVRPPTLTQSEHGGMPKVNRKEYQYVRITVSPNQISSNSCSGSMARLLVAWVGQRRDMVWIGSKYRWPLNFRLYLALNMTG